MKSKEAEDAVNTMRFVRDEPLLAIGTLGGLLHIYCFKEEEDSHGRETLDPVAALEGNGTVYGITCLATTDRIIAVGGKHERVHLFELYEEMSTDPNDPDHRDARCLRSSLQPDGHQAAFATDALRRRPSYRLVV